MNEKATETQLEEIISDLSRLRSRMDELDLPPSEARQKLADHLSLATVAALRLRFKSGDDDLVVEG